MLLRFSTVVTVGDGLDIDRGSMCMASSVSVGGGLEDALIVVEKGRETAVGAYAATGELYGKREYSNLF